MPEASGRASLPVSVPQAVGQSAGAVSFLAQLWAAILEDSPGKRPSEPLHDYTSLGDGQRGDTPPASPRSWPTRMERNLRDFRSRIRPQQKGNKMTSRTAGQIAEITAIEVSTLEDEVNNAVDKSRAKAEREGRHGILVTRYGHTRFTIEISPEVP